MRLKEIAASVLYHGGAVRLLSHGYCDSLIVSYHHVLPPDDWMISFLQPGMYVTTTTFEQQICYLAQHYTIGTLDNLDDLSCQRTCIITFDDGWSDNYMHAFPILQRFNVPATIFIATNLVGTTEWPWPDRISYYLKRGTRTQLQVIYEQVAHEGFVQVAQEALKSNNHYQAIEEVIGCLKRLSHSQVMRLIGNIDRLMLPLYDDLHTRRPWLSWDDIQTMRSRGIAFGAHTHNHKILTNCTTDEAQEEIVTSVETLSRHLGKPVRLFSYPNGDYNGSVVDILRRQGLTHAVTTRSGSIAASEDCMSLRRFMLHEDMTRTIPMLACRLTGRIPFY